MNTPSKALPFVAFILLLATVSYGAAKEDFQYSSNTNTVVYKYIIQEPTDVYDIRGTRFIRILSENDERETRVTIIPKDRLLSITEKITGPYTYSDKYTIVRFTTVEELRGKALWHTTIELKIHEDYCTFNEVVDMMN